MKHTPKRLLALLLASLMMLGTISTALAAETGDQNTVQLLHAEGEEDSGTHDETPYSITIYNEKAPNKNGSLTYTVTCHEDGEVSGPYGINDSGITAVQGDTITLYPVANESYVLSSIGYAKVERVEQAFNIKSVDAQDDGSYTFAMPDYPVYVGAAFYAEDDYYVLKEAGASNSVANVDPLHLIELGLNDAWLHENAEEVSVDMHLDARILEFGETAGKDLTFRMEIREVGNSGFVLKGSQEYTVAQLKALVEEKSASVETDEKGRQYYVLRDVTIPVDADQDFTYAADGEFEVYCTAMYTLDGWTNAIGAPYYRWGYSGGDRAFIMQNETQTPTSMVYLYNLEPETYHGALVAEAIDRVEEEFGITIETRYFTAENMTERIGYLAEWPGYESYGELGVDRQPSEKTYKKKIVLYCSLPSMVRDTLGDYIRETGVTNLLSSKLTAYGAAKSFEEFYKTQETEASVFTAALALSLLTYETSTAVPESEYGSHELWPEFKTAFDEAKAIINSTKEQEESVYTNARLKLLDVYLRIIGKVQLTTEFKFLINEYDENNYKITVDQSNWPEDLEVEYRWYDASKQDHLIIPKDQLYKVRCSISAVDDGPYYGFKEISLAPPTELEYEVSSKSNNISVAFTKYETLTNTPEPITYTADLYEGDEQKATLSNTTANPLTFSGLKSNTEYKVRVYASNIVGRTTYTTETVTTGKATVSTKPSVTPAVPEKETNTTFKDVSADQYYAAAVTWAVEAGITSGTSATTFSPSAACTRAQTVTFLWRAAGSPMPVTKVCPFTDVAKDAYYYNAVLWAYENGITGGTSATTFSPDATVTRAQNVTFLWRWAGSPAAEQGNPFKDVAADAYYHDAVIWAAEEGITSGTSATTFNPNDSCLRSQIVTFLYRFMAE